MKALNVENDKLAAEFDKFQVTAEADTEKSLTEAAKVADFLSHNFGVAGNGHHASSASKLSLLATSWNAKVTRLLATSGDTQ